MTCTLERLIWLLSEETEVEAGEGEGGVGVRERLTVVPVTLP